MNRPKEYPVLNVENVITLPIPDDVNYLTTPKKFLTPSGQKLGPV